MIDDVRTDGHVVSKAVSDDSAALIEVCSRWSITEGGRDQEITLASISAASSEDRYISNGLLPLFTRNNVAFVLTSF